MPVTRGSGHAGGGLVAASFLMEALEIVAGGTVDEEDEGLVALRNEVECAVIDGEADVEEGIGEPDLILDGEEGALLIGGDGSRDGVDSVETVVGVAGAVVEESGVEDVLGGDVVLEAKEIVASPGFARVCAGGLLIDDHVDVLNADGIGEPETAALEGTGEVEARVPVAEMDAFLNVDTGKRVGGAETPAVVAVGSFEAEDAGAGVGVTGAEIGGLDFGGAGGVDVEAGGKSVVDGVADFEAVEEILRFAGTRARDVKIIEIVLRDFGEGGEALREDMGAGDGNVSDVAGSERVALGGVLRIDLIGAGGDLDLFVDFLGVIENEVEFVRAGLKSDGTIGDEEEALLADFEFVIAGGEVLEGEAASAVGFGAEDVGGGVFEFELDGGDGDGVFIEDEAGAGGEVRGARGSGREEDYRKQGDCK